VASIQNKVHRISGHLSYTKEFDVCQLIEGRSGDVCSLMACIRKDPRIIVYEEFSKILSTKNHKWYIAMCYTFELSSEKFRCWEDEDTTPAEMFDNLKNTFQVRLSGCRITEFYKKEVDMLLLKYLSIIDEWKSSVQYNINYLFHATSPPLIKNKSCKWNLQVCI